MGARWYDPVGGRFYATDPVAFTERNPHSFSRYAYANNNPYRYVDPDGNSPLAVGIGIGVGIGLLAYDIFRTPEINPAHPQAILPVMAPWEPFIGVGSSAPVRVAREAMQHGDDIARGTPFTEFGVEKLTHRGNPGQPLTLALCRTIATLQDCPKKTAVVS